ncbi:MAG: immunoglobulin domain-containing protein, partial [Flavobacteriales bacterium]
PDPDLFRNNDSPSYPYTVPNVVSITSSSAGNDFYYFFYDWQITTPGCISERTPVVANIGTSPTVQGASRCGTGSVVLSASGDGDLNWFNTATNGTLVNTGTNFTTPSISTTTSYFVECEIAPAPQFGGAPDNNFGTGSAFNNVQSLLFDCYEPVTLVSVKVYAEGAGNRTIELRDATGTVIENATVNIPDGESRVELNFNLPTGTNLQLGTSAGPNLYRNNSGPDYPYNIPGLLSITSSTAGNDFYYFFYDWEVQKEGCSTARTEVIATINPNPTVSVAGENSVCDGGSVSITTEATDVESYSWSPGGETTADILVNPTVETTYSVTASNVCGDATGQITVDVNTASQPEITLDGSQLTSTTAATYQWYLNGLPINGENQMSLTPIATGSYSVEITDENGCASISEGFEWIAVGIQELTNNFSIQPNPFNNQLSVYSEKNIERLKVMD